MTCNICDDSVQDALLRGQRPERGSLHCEVCASRPRTRTFRLVYDEQVAPWLDRHSLPGKALDIAGIGATADVLRANFPDVVVAALVGRKITTDIRDLKEFDDGAFGIVTACQVLDYILEIDAAIAATRRVLAPGGLFVIHIDDARLTAGDDPATPKAWLENLGGYYPDDYKVPSITVGRQRIMESLASGGFQAEQFQYSDPFSGQRTTWFIGRRLADPVATPTRVEASATDAPPPAPAEIRSDRVRRGEPTYVLFTIDTETNRTIENGFWSYCVNGHLPSDIDALIEAGVVARSSGGYSLVGRDRQQFRDLASREPHIRRLADASPRATGGLPLIFDALRPYGFPAVVMVDMSAYGWFGDADFTETIRICNSDGHDVQLHAHLTTLDKSWFAEFDIERPLSKNILEWPTETMKAIHGTLADQLASLTGGHTPTAYRAGAYRCSDQLIDALAELGFAFDSSYDHTWLDRHTICRDRAVGNAPFRYRDLIELPITAVRHGSQLRRFEPRPWDETLGPLELGALDALHREGVRVVTYILHSYSLMEMRRSDNSRAWRGPSAKITEWFQRTLDHIAHHPGLEVVDSVQLSALIDEDPTILLGSDALVSL
ncbi:MAG: methyltransferase domain-containing protein [Solirubrobacteraceae bacterium]|nr:methyltransferase domain-containing protein [Solirubrobacteraceae bacterium]